MATQQVRIDSDAHRLSKCAAAAAGMSHEAWVTAAVMEKLSAAHYAERLAGIRATQS